MEDQQPAAGDLTDQASDEAPAKDFFGEYPAIEDTVADEPSAPRKRVAGKGAGIIVGIAAALFVGAGAFAGAAVQPYLADRAAVATKLDIARTAAEAITTLWTYTPDDMDRLPDRSAKFLSGDFQDQYRKYVDAIVPTNKQAKVTNTTQVVGTAVESLRGDEATALVYTNTTSTSPLSKNIPSMRYLSYRLQLTRKGGDWLVNKMTTVTSLDLTPQI
ncbi:Mce associated membrane protein [Mycolicibacterium anyangense]|uniref:Mce associated membrane protein n=1 Tax=Mycolicibacterium anyangense TaxID=1431246 RepID=A0A6N4WEK0_9MYCO|nr:Mce associated membrane protein [Mycolicibacterium anyangense]